MVKLKGSRDKVLNLVEYMQPWGEVSKYQYLASPSENPVLLVYEEIQMQ